MHQPSWNSIKQLAKVSAAVTFFVFSVACSHEGVQTDAQASPQSPEPMSAEVAPPVVETPPVQEPLNTQPTWPAPKKIAHHKTKHKKASSKLAAHKAKSKHHKKHPVVAKHLKPKPVETASNTVSSGIVQDQAAQMQLPPPPPAPVLPASTPTSDVTAVADNGGGILNLLMANWAYGVFGVGLIGTLAWVANSRRGGRSSKSRGLVFNA